MFLDTIEPRTKNKNSSLEKKSFDNVDSDMLNNCLIVHKITLKKIVKFGPQGVNFCITQFATRFTHVFRQYQTKNRKQ